MDSSAVSLPVLEAMPRHSEGSYAIAYLKYLEEHGVPYCLAGQMEGFPEQIRSDVDIIVYESDLKSVLRYIETCSTALGVRIVQVIQHEQNAFYHVIDLRTSNSAFLKLDVCGNYRRNGRLLIDSRRLLSGREKVVMAARPGVHFWRASFEKEFMYYLVKKIDKSSLHDDAKDYLSLVWHRASEKPNPWLDELFGPAFSRLIAHAAECNAWIPVDAALPALKRKLRARSGRRTSTDLLAEMRRMCARFVAPTGLHVVLLGVDGSGKTTVSRQLTEVVEDAFRRQEVIHLRPIRLAMRSTAPAVDPHAGASRGRILSTAQVLFWSATYLLGWIVWIYPKLARSTLIIFDRYYHDILVDPKRYRYGAPLWIAQLAAKIVPKPDLWILLDASVEIVQARKSEVTAEETGRQRAVYRDVVSSFRNHIILDATRPAAEVTAQARSAILDYMAHRIRRRWRAG